MYICISLSLSLCMYVYTYIYIYIYIHIGPSLPLLLESSSGWPAVLLRSMRLTCENFLALAGCSVCACGPFSKLGPAAPSSSEPSAPAALPFTFKS